MILNSLLHKSISIINTKTKNKDKINLKDHVCLQKLKKCLKNTQREIKSENELHELTENIISSKVGLTIDEQFKTVSIICSHKAYRFHLCDLIIKNNSLYKYIRNRTKHCSVSQFLFQFCEKKELDSVENHFFDFKKGTNAEDDSFSSPTSEIPTFLYDSELSEFNSVLQNTLYLSDNNSQPRLFYLSTPIEIAKDNRCRPIMTSDLEILEYDENFPQPELA